MPTARRRRSASTQLHAPALCRTRGACTWPSFHRRTSRKTPSPDKRSCSRVISRVCSGDGSGSSGTGSGSARLRPESAVQSHNIAFSIITHATSLGSADTKPHAATRPHDARAPRDERTSVLELDGPAVGSAPGLQSAVHSTVSHHFTMLVRVAAVAPEFAASACLGICSLIVGTRAAPPRRRAARATPPPPHAPAPPHAYGAAAVLRLRPPRRRPTPRPLARSTLARSARPADARVPARSVHTPLGASLRHASLTQRHRVGPRAHDHGTRSHERAG